MSPPFLTQRVEAWQWRRIDPCEVFGLRWGPSAEHLGRAASINTVSPLTCWVSTLCSRGQEWCKGE